MYFKEHAQEEQGEEEKGGEEEEDGKGAESGREGEFTKESRAEEVFPEVPPSLCIIPGIVERVPEDANGIEGEETGNALFRVESGVQVADVPDQEGIGAMFGEETGGMEPSGKKEAEDHRNAP